MVDSGLVLEDLGFSGVYMTDMLYPKARKPRSLKLGSLQPPRFASAVQGLGNSTLFKLRFMGYRASVV